MDKKPTLTAPLIEFDFAAKLIGARAAIPKEEKKAETKVATRKMAVKKVKPPPSPLAKILRTWKTEDLQLDFQLTFDDASDPQVNCVDADNGDDGVDLAADIAGIDEIIAILTNIKTAALRIMSGDIKPEDSEDPDAEEEEEEELDEEEEPEDSEE